MKNARIRKMLSQAMRLSKVNNGTGVTRIEDPKTGSEGKDQRRTALLRVLPKGMTARKRSLWERKYA